MSSAKVGDKHDDPTPAFAPGTALPRSRRTRQPAFDAVSARPAPAKGIFLIGCLLLWLGLLLAGPTRHDPTHAIGRDQPFVFHADRSGVMSLDDFLALPADALTTSRRPLTYGYTDAPVWLRFTVPQAWFDRGDLWFEVRPGYLDHVSIYWRAADGSTPWQKRLAGDREGALPRLGDLNYRFPVFALAPPPGAHGYDVVMRVQSTSTIMVEAALWRPAEFLEHAVRDSVFWSFHFGMGALSSAIALLLAIGLKSRLLWSVLPFSTTYLLVACIQGYVGWSQAEWRVDVQHYLTGILSLLGYPALLWMCTEALDLRRHFPRLYQAAIAGTIVGLLLPLSIPFGLYGESVRALAVLAFLTAPFVVACSLVLWWRERVDYLNLAFGIIPLFYIVSGLLAVLTTTAVIPYDSVIYGLWQYSVMMIMMFTMLLVMTVGVYRIRRERQVSRERAQFARELRLEREASFQQRQFMGMISHEFRTPLAVISAALENLRAGSANDAGTQQRYDKIERAANRLVQLTDNCLADARLSAGTMYLDLAATDLIEQIRWAASLVEVADHHELRMAVGGRALNAEAAASIPVHADAALLRIALSNLLDNAVKYSAPGTQVRLDVQRHAGRLVIGIEDEGPGIAPEQAAQIFERYRQARPGAEAQRDGWGLGLYVARQIARAHHGDVVLAANTPQGCRFELILPHDTSGALSP